MGKTKINDIRSRSLEVIIGVNAQPGYIGTQLRLGQTDDSAWGAGVFPQAGAEGKTAATAARALMQRHRAIADAIEMVLPELEQLETGG